MSNMMKFIEELKKKEYYTVTDFSEIECDKDEKDKFLSYIDEIMLQNKSKLLFRGVQMKKLENKLISKVSPHNNLIYGLFLIGDKAKNYLLKKEEIPHCIQEINSWGSDVANFIFDRYSEIGSRDTNLKYFRNPKNRMRFVDQIKGDKELIDYYLAGLHQWNSDNLVNFVSTTMCLSTALSYGNDLVILLWIPENYYKNIVSEITNSEINTKLKIKKLPVIYEFFKEEEEYSFKGFIPPHFILGVMRVADNAIFINPALLANMDDDWINNGFEIQSKKFFEFIKTTKYKRFISLYEDETFEDNEIDY